MKIIFAHDHKFYFDNSGRYFSPGNFYYRIWKRYLDVFDQIIVLARAQYVEAPKNMKEASGPNVTIVPLPNASSIKTRIFNSSTIGRLIREQIGEADGIIARLPSVIGNLAIKTAIKLDKPWAIEVVGCAWDSYWTHGSILAKLFAPYAYFSTKRIVAKSKFTLYVTKSFLQKRYPTRGEQINCSNVEIEKIDNNIILNRLKFLSEDEFPLKIGFIGSLATKTKGLETAFKAINYLKNSMQEPFIFEIVGDGPTEKWIKLIEKFKIKNFVSFKGRLRPGAEINSWLDQCHLYLQPSYTEGLPRSVIEAMSRGCTVIASNVGGIPELLDSDFLINPKNWKQLANKILYSLKNKDVLTKQAKRNITVAKEYEKGTLDVRRKNFWNKFANSIKTNESK